MGEYKTGQVCRNGHRITSDYDGNPELRAKFCSDCGAATIHQCESCSTPIRGRYDNPGFIRTTAWQPPSYCHECGQPYPWTSAAIEAANELADDADLDAEDRDKLKKSIAALAEGGPRSEAAGVRFQAIMKKAGPVVGKAMRDILVSVLSEAAKKSAGL